MSVRRGAHPQLSCVVHICVGLGCLITSLAASVEKPAWWEVGMPPYSVPDEHRIAFTMNGTVPIAKMYIDDSNGGKGTHYTAEKADVDSHVKQFEKMLKQGVPAGSRWAWLFQGLQAVPIVDKTVVVLGSTEPTVEAAMLAHGAAHVTTIEYNRLTFHHPKLSQLQVGALAVFDEKFDIAISMSSFDHDGLGRYNDPIEPDGDLKAPAFVGRLECYTAFRMG